MEDLALGRLGQVARSVRDISESTAWYADVLGLTHLYAFDTLAFFDLDGTRLYLSEGEVRDESLLYLQVDDIGAAHAALVARGVTFVQEPHLVHTHADGTQEWMGFFSDPEGRPLALISQVHPGEA